MGIQIQHLISSQLAISVTSAEQTFGELLRIIKKKNWLAIASFTRAFPPNLISKKVDSMAKFITGQISQIRGN